MSTPELVVGMPRGGPRAPWWDRAYEPTVLEWLDDPAIPQHRKAAVIAGLDRWNRRSGAYWLFSRATLSQLPADATEARVLELGAGHGALSVAMADALRSRGLRARVVASDISAEYVRAMSADERLRSRGVTALQLDATALALADGSFDVAVLTQTLHHLEPPQVVSLLREATRVARRLVIIDGWRAPWMLLVTPPIWLLGNYPAFRDGVVSLRRMYSRRALLHLCAQAGVHVEAGFMPPGYLRAVVSREPFTSR
ncbi:MAG: class I SAM-dependent methyltransferase [Myxococcota bacterium]